MDGTYEFLYNLLTQNCDNFVNQCCNNQNWGKQNVKVVKDIHQVLRMIGISDKPEFTEEQIGGGIEVAREAFKPFSQGAREVLTLEPGKVVTGVSRLILAKETAKQNATKEMLKQGNTEYFEDRAQKLKAVPQKVKAAVSKVKFLWNFFTSPKDDQDDDQKEGQMDK